MEEITLFQEKKISEIKLDIYGVPDLSNWPQIFEIQNTAQKCYYTIKQHEKVMCSVSGGYDSDIVLDLVIRCGGRAKTTIVNDSIVGYVNNYLKTTKIHIGGGWNSDNVEEYTAEEYLKKQIKDVFESQSFTVKQKDRWGSMKEEKVSFQEYLQNYLNIEAEVKPYMDKMAKCIRDDVNKKVKTLFDDAMRSTLAENVFAIVSASDTYRSVSNSLKMLGN